MNPLSFLEILAELRFENTFNPYSDVCGDFDGPNAPAIRRSNLGLVLEAALASGVDSLWIARDLGHRGGRRTGLALTDEVHLPAHASLYGSLPLARATRGPIMAERTAYVIWQVLRDLNRPIFLWNVFPLHPHEPSNPLSNRCHTRAERRACRPLLMWLMETLKPRTVVTIGRDADLALKDLGIASTKVRHPSYGGQREFLKGIYSHYSLPPPTNPIAEGFL
jgi:Uracil DNA glycosylase superfamily